MKVGIVDDDEELASMLADGLDQQAYATPDPNEVLDWVRTHKVDCVVTDLKMQPLDGLELLENIHRVDRNTPVVLITGHGTVDTAVDAMKKGARDFLQKPVGTDEFQVVIDRIHEEHERQKHLEGFRHNQRDRSRQDSLLVGSSEPIQELRQLIRQVSAETVSVLVEGETGTGKELVAREIHARSNRSGAPFMSVNCAAIPPNLMESELYGHEQGAFTGADEQRKGKFELADGGTLFLDEIGELPVDLQPKLLRSLDQDEITRIGAEHSQAVDVRMISATNRNLDKLIDQDQFRKDLYYRLNTIKIKTPPLREHPDDIPELVEHFLEQLAIGDQMDLSEPLQFSDQALDTMMAYRWPGNVRELKNIVERAAILSPDETIQLGDLPEDLRDGSGAKEGLSGEWTQWGSTLPEALETLERHVIKQTLEQSTSKSQAAEKLGISRQSLHYKLGKISGDD